LLSVLKNRRRVAGRPRFLTYTVTFRCNARCIMCDSWKMPSRNDLNLEELDQIFIQLPAMDAVRLTGGEPFTRRDLPEIASLVQRHLQPLVLHVTTNGFLTDRIVSWCEQRDKRTPLRLLISIDGVEEKHNQVRGVRHAWSSVMETIRALAPRQKQLGIQLAVNQTIVDEEGGEHYGRLREILRSHGVCHDVVVAYDVSATYNLEQGGNVAPSQIGEFVTFGDFANGSLERLLDEAEKDLPKLPYFERIARRYYLRGIRNRLLSRIGRPNPPCVALNSHLRIFPNGDVPTCQFNGRTVGNLRNESFEEIWRRDRTQRQRKWVRRCPGCWAECEVLPNALYTLDIARALL
jgi:MoaA/NifB/PqqE/SkfB family radical SAM enzyme